MPATLAPPRTAAAPSRLSARRTWVPLAVWTVLVAGCIGVGWRLRADGLLRIGGVPPFHGWPRATPLGWQLLPALAFAGLAIAVAPRVARTARAERLRDLHGEGAYPSRGAVDQNLLARSDVAVVT